MSAVIGVGPGMASGNQVCNGTWADFPTTATISSSPIAVALRGSSSPAASIRWLMRYEPYVWPRTMIATSRPMSALRVTMNALAAPARACGSSHVCPISR